MEMIVFVGCQGAGKSTFYREHFFKTHVRVSLDMLKTRNRERLLTRTCLDMQQRLVIDNTNPTAEDRQRYLVTAREAGFKVIAYFFDATLDELLERNGRRAGKENIPEIAIRGTLKKLEPPAHAEGFDDIFRVKLEADGTWHIERLDREV